MENRPPFLPLLPLTQPRSELAITISGYRNSAPSLRQEVMQSFGIVTAVSVVAASAWITTMVLKIK